MATVISNLRRNTVAGQENVFLFDRVSDVYQEGQPVASFLDGNLVSYQDWSADFPFSSVGGVSEGVHTVWIAAVDPDSGSEVPGTRSNAITFNTAEYPLDGSDPGDGGDNGGGGTPPVDIPGTLPPELVQIRIGNIDLIDGTSLALGRLPNPETPELEDDDYKVEGLDGVRARKGKAVNLYTYGASEFVIPVTIDGDLNEDGSTNTTTSPQTRAAQLRKDLIRETNGEVLITVYRADGSIWTNVGRRVAKAVFSNRAYDSYYELDLTLKLPDPKWTRVSDDVIVTIEDTGGRGLIIDDLADLDCRITDARITISCASSITVKDLTTGTGFTYNAPASGLVIDCDRPLDPLNGQGDWLAFQMNGGVRPLIIGDGKTTPAISVSGGTAVISCKLKSLIAF